MTRDEIMALEGREFRIRMAEFCGYKPRLVTRFRYSDLQDELCSDGWVALDGSIVKYLPDFENDANAARLVLAEVERRGKIEEFVRQLRRTLYRDHGDDDAMPQLWRFATATPSQIARAALLSCMEVE